MVIVVEVLVVVLATGQMAEPGHAANGVFEPVPVWPFEYFVVKTSRPKLVREIQHTTDVKVDAGKADRRLDLMAIPQCAQSCTDYGNITIAIERSQQCIRLFHARGHDAARPMVFETPVNRADAVGKQCRCDRVALITLQRLVVEFERQWLAAINSTTRRHAVFL